LFDLFTIFYHGFSNYGQKSKNIKKTDLFPPFSAILIYCSGIGWNLEQKQNLHLQK